MSLNNYSTREISHLWCSASHSVPYSWYHGGNEDVQVVRGGRTWSSCLSTRRWLYIFFRVLRSGLAGRSYWKLLCSQQTKLSNIIMRIFFLHISCLPFHSTVRSCPLLLLAYGCPHIFVIEVLYHGLLCFPDEVIDCDRPYSSNLIYIIVEYIIIIICWVLLI